MPREPREHRGAPRRKRGGCFKAFVSMLVTLAACVLLFLAATAGASWWVVFSTQGDMETADQAVETRQEFDADCIIVLGAGIRYDGSPSTILGDRLDTAIDLYKRGAAPKIVMSGDNTLSTYNEVMAMCNYAVEHGVPAEDVFCDHAGVNTYDSMYRLKTVFGAQRVLVVTQQYHLYRAVYVAKGLGMEARGVASDAHEYANMDSYEKREFLARIKDFYQVITKPNAEHLSSPVSLEGSGEETQWWR